MRIVLGIFALLFYLVFRGLIAAVEDIGILR